MTTEPTTPTPRRRLPFSVRTMLLVVAGLAILIGTAAATRRAHQVLRRQYFASLEPRLTEQLGGKAVRDTIANAQSIDLYRLGPPSVKWQDAKPGDYQVTSGPVPIPRADTAFISKMLNDPASFDWGPPCGCVVEYMVRMRFKRQSSEVWIDCMWNCPHLAVHRNREWIGWHRFRPVEGELLAIVKKAFPNDPEIRNLKLRP